MLTTNPPTENIKHNYCIKRLGCYQPTEMWASLDIIMLHMNINLHSYKAIMTEVFFILR